MSRRTGGVSPGGYPLPPKAFRMGGRHFASNVDFVSGALRDVARLEQHARLTPDSEILDLGCGAGRLAVGLLERYHVVRQYIGVDVQPHLIRWARRFLGSYLHVSFELLDVQNDRYNPSGRGLVQIPTLPDSLDVVYAYSLFSHLAPSHIERYLSEIRRVLRPTGTAVFTAFVEKGSFAPRVNPHDYGMVEWSGPLHCVLLSSGYLEAALDSAGLALLRDSMGTETDGQSMYVVAQR